MPKLIEFVHDWFAEVESTPGRLKQVSFRKGARVLAEITTLSQTNTRAESADLRLADGTTALHVPLTRFAICDEQARAA